MRARHAAGRVPVRVLGWPAGSVVRLHRGARWGRDVARASRPLSAGASRSRPASRGLAILAMTGHGQHARGVAGETPVAPPESLTREGGSHTILRKGQVEFRGSGPTASAMTSRGRPIISHKGGHQ
jgi:hypothetical protein